MLNGFCLITDLAQSRVSPLCVAFIFSYPVSAVNDSICILIQGASEGGVVDSFEDVSDFLLLVCYATLIST